MEKYHMTTETLTPEQQAAAQAPSQQDPSPTGTAADAPEGYVEVARFNGLMQRNEALSAQLTEANGNLATRTSSLEQSQKQITDLEAAQEAQADEAPLTQTQLNEQISTLEAQSAGYNSLQLKLKVANEMGRPELMALADHIPMSTDEVVIKDAFTAFAGFADGAAKSREVQLLSGASPAGSVGTGGAPAMPTTPEGWANYVNSFTLGTPEREAALKAFGKAAQEQSQR
jgi:hypothetical protein